MALQQRHYPLRHRQIHRGGPARGGAGGDGDEEALATLFVGLQPKAMTKQERVAFGNRMAEYLEARCVCGSGGVLAPSRAKPSRDALLRLVAHIWHMGFPPTR